MRSLNRYYNKQAKLWPKVIAFGLSATFFAPVWGTPADVMTTPAAVPGDPAPKSRALSVVDATVSTRTGALEYSIPITVPPGRGGATPKLSLSYSSQGSIYGGIAAGWSLNIPRIRQDFSGGVLRDGDPVRYTSTLAGGKRLVPVTESAPSNVEQTYRTQHDSSYARYRKMDSIASHEWEVHLPSGSKLFFGEGFTTLPLSHSVLTRQEDSFGNTIVYNWTPVFTSVWAELVLDSIEYSSNAGAGLPAHARIDFTWTTPPSCGNSDIPIGAEAIAESSEKSAARCVSTRSKRP